ncbi:hypothetical protein KUTeg_015564 [Tegillarca granosa]|uniref:NADH dehydrogenase [ubiquinone] 1 alpha subcomplex subunit 8 n=1 Tax=Tegillarca granosa TaxID=220873 RepID=A0ABQ9EUX1_TEGGR|nr:hypothetical protein KUTeg_015564 [Tegillarca granosa]
MQGIGKIIMVFTKEDYLPSEAELTIEELPLSSSVLKAGSLYFGQYCDNQSKEFMLCSQELKDPRKCLNEGKEVTRCGFEFFKKLKQNCNPEFAAYHECIYRSGGKGRSMDFRYCRKQQKVLDKCLFEKMGISRPPIGYFSMVRVHKTDRPKPAPSDTD